LLKKNPKNEKSPVILVTSKVNNELIKKLVREGWGDVLIKPLDQSLFLQKMNLYHKGRPIMKDATLFSMDSEHEIDIAFMYHTKTISEYGMKIIANQPLAMGVVVTLHADFLGIEILAQVIEVTKVADDSYTVQMMFIGVTAAETQAVRKFIRHEYAEEKQAG
jgi:response regulator of citrate/malate metabolism